MFFEVKVTIVPPEGKTIKIKALTFLVKSELEINAKVEALNRAKQTQASSPRKYKGCTFKVLSDGVKQFS